MTTKTTYTATLPGGELATRKSVRTYTHLVAARHNSYGNTKGDFTESADWHVIGWCGTPELAQKQASSAQARVAISKKDRNAYRMMRWSLPWYHNQKVYADVRVIEVNS